MRWVFILIVTVAGVAWGQISIDEAYAKLQARQASTSQPATQPTTGPATRQAVKDVPARRIVFVLDASGTMYSVFDDARAELAKAINNLSQKDSFALLVYQNKATCIETMQPASDWIKGDAIERLRSVVPQMGGDTLVALTEAFKMKPTAIWLISDGDTADQSGIITACRKMNAGKKVKINTTLKYCGDNARADVRINQDFLLRLARESGGICIDADGRPVVSIQVKAKPRDKPEVPPGPSIFDFGQ